MRRGFAHAQAPANSRARKSVRGRVLGFTSAAGCALTLGAVAAFAPTAAAAAAPAAGTADPAASSAAGWLTPQLSSGRGLMPGLSAGAPDVGLTSDALLSLVAAGQRQEPVFAASLAAVASHLSGYATFPTGSTTALLAGPVAKTLFLAQVSGADPTSFGGLDLPATLRSLLTTSGTNSGRFSDHGTGSDTSNGFSQAFAVLGLLHDRGGVPESAVSFLLAQQCPSGAFRLFYDTPGGCRDNSQADPDATSVTIQALSALLTTDPGQSALSTARSAAAQWLVSRQQPDGGLGGAGPTAAENANTTALAAVAFRETGQPSAAEAAQRYVARLQLPSGPDAGAVAYDSAALAALGHATSIPSTDQDQWRRSTAQAIVAFGLPGYDTLPTVAGSPLPPGTPSPTPTPTPTPTTAPTPLPTGPPPAQQAAGTPPPVANEPDPAENSVTSSDSADFADPGDLSETDMAPDGLADDTLSDDAADEPTDSVDNSQSDEPATTPSVNPPAAQTTAPQANAPLTHATPQAAVAAKSADGGVPSWVWIAVAAGAGVGGGVVVLRLQTRRARS
jgi:hypothetical protein